MSKLKGLLLTEGMHGMISQVEGLAKALDIDFIHQKVEINTLAKLLPPKITPISNLFFKRFSVPEIDLVISCGWKSVIASLNLKKKSNKKGYKPHVLFLTQIQNINNFRIAKDIDHIYFENYKKAKKAGVKFLAYRCKLSSKEIKIEKKINILDDWL